MRHPFSREWGIQYIEQFLRNVAAGSDRRGHAGDGVFYYVHERNGPTSAKLRRPVNRREPYGDEVHIVIGRVVDSQPFAHSLGSSVYGRWIWGIVLCHWLPDGGDTVDRLGAGEDDPPNTDDAARLQYVGGALTIDLDGQRWPGLGFEAQK